MQSNIFRFYPVNITLSEVFKWINESVNINRSALGFHFARTIIKIFHPNRYSIVSCGIASGVAEFHSLNTAVKNIMSVHLVHYARSFVTQEYLHSATTSVMTFISGVKFYICLRIIVASEIFAFGVHYIS